MELKKFENYLKLLLYNTSSMTYLNKISLQEKRNRRLHNSQEKQLLELKALIGEVHLHKKGKMLGNSNSRRSKCRNVLIQANPKTSRKSGKFNVMVE